MNLSLPEEQLQQVPRDITVHLASAIANRCKATGVRQSLRTYDAHYKTVLRLAQRQVKFRAAREKYNIALNHNAFL
jgi:hypothetical protein